jgi:hypothetical protein
MLCRDLLLEASQPIPEPFDQRAQTQRRDPLTAGHIDRGQQRKGFLRHPLLGLGVDSTQHAQRLVGCPLTVLEADTAGVGEESTCAQE